MMDVSSASAGGNSAPWPPSSGPNSLPSQDVSQQHLRGIPPSPLHHPMRMGHPPSHRVPMRPFFVREIYKNGFLKRLAHNEKKSSALSKLMRSDRYWVVFSVHDLGAEQMPFLELWHEPTEVATRPPQFMFPLSVCQHISPSLVPADNEWTFVVNFETAAIRFSCNSRQTMEEWVECIRMKLCEMGILNPKGNLYSKVPLIPGQMKSTTTGVGRNPMSPLPEPPSPATASATAATTTTTTEAEVISSADANETISHQPRTRTSIVDVSDQNNQSFTTSIYLNQSAAGTGKQTEVEGASSVPAPTQQHVIPARSYEPVTVIPPVTTSATATLSSSTLTSTTTPSSGIKGIKWSVYLSKSKPTRHVTVIPINNNNLDVDAKPPSSPTEKDQPEITNSTEELQKSEEEFEGEHFYDAIFELEEGSNLASAASVSAASKANNVSLARPKRERRRQQSPPPKAPPLPTSYEAIVLQSNESRTSSNDDHRRSKAAPTTNGREGGRSPGLHVPFNKEPVGRQFSDRRESRHSSGQHAATSKQHQQQQPMRIRKKSQRSSSLGPLLDDNQLLLSSNLAQRSANTNSLESIASNPRRAVAKNDSHPHHGHPHRDRETGAVPRRPLQAVASLGPTEGQGGNLGSPPRMLNEFSRPLPPYLPLVMPGMPGSGSTGPAAAHPPHPPHIPLPGLTCQLSVLPPPSDLQPTHTLRPSLREQQVHRLRQEIAHPAGVRLTLRKRDCQGSLALVEFFGCLWVAGWRQRDYPVLYNAFHIGDQILSVSGVPVRTASEFNKLVKQKSLSSTATSSNNTPGPEVIHVEIVIRRLPFAQVFHLKRDVEGQPLGIVTHGNTAEVREIIPSSPASQHGMTPKIRSFDGQTLVPWVLTEINGRPLNLFSKDGEAGDRLQALGRDVSVLLQPSDIVAKLKKQLKSHRNYKEFLLG